MEDLIIFFFFFFLFFTGNDIFLSDQILESEFNCFILAVTHNLYWPIIQISFIDLPIASCTQSDWLLQPL